MDIPGEKLLIKLWETVAEKGIGSLFKPWQMRREGHASIEIKREELLAIAQAEHDAERIRRGEVRLVGSEARLTIESVEHIGEAPEVSEAEQRLTAANRLLIADKIREEANLARALLHAEEALESDPQAPPEAKVDEDWLYRWRDNASNVSSEQLQNLWGRVLAGEIKAPGTFSLRTLEFLRNLTQQEATSIALLSRFVVGNAIFRDAQNLLDAEGVTFGFLLKMQQLGVISGVEAIGLTVTWNSLESSRFVRALTSNSMVLIVSATDPTQRVALPVYQLTFIGEEILRLGKFEPHVPYLEKVGEHLKKQNVKVELAQYVDTAPGQIRYFGGREL